MSVTVYPTNKTFKLDICGIIFDIKPMSREEKTATLECINNKEGSIEINATKSSWLLMKFCIKGITGLKNPDGSDYMLEMGKDGMLSDQTLDDLTNLSISNTMMTALFNMLNGIPEKHFYDGTTREVLKDVKFVTKGIHREKKS